MRCLVPDCFEETPRKAGEGKGRHFFSVPRRAEIIEKWTEALPNIKALTHTHRICDLHFEERFILKCHSFLINGERVEIPRVKWSLTADAVPTIFHEVANLSKSSKPKARRKSYRRVSPLSSSPSVDGQQEASDQNDVLLPSNTNKSLTTKVTLTKKNEVVTASESQTQVKPRTIPQKEIPLRLSPVIPSVPVEERTTTLEELMSTNHLLAKKCNRLIDQLNVSLVRLVEAEAKIKTLERRRKAVTDMVDISDFSDAERHIVMAIASKYSKKK